MPTATKEPLREALDSELFQAIARAGQIERDELAYQLDKRGIELDEAELDRLSDDGLIEADGECYAVVVPERTEHGNGKKRLDDEDILDRIRLWALVVGRPPAMASWQPSKLAHSEARLRTRAQHHRDLIDLYERGDFPSSRLVAERFGSMNAALVAAGYEPRSTGRQPREPVVPRKPGKQWGAKELSAAAGRVKRARSARDEEELYAALIELATAAFNEADKLKPWEPHA